MGRPGRGRGGGGSHEVAFNATRTMACFLVLVFLLKRRFNSKNVKMQGRIQEKSNSIGADRVLNGVKGVSRLMSWIEKKGRYMSQGIMGRGGHRHPRCKVKAPLPDTGFPRPCIGTRSTG